MNIPNSHQFHIDPTWVVDNAVCIPVGALYRQMTKVLRLRKGDAVRCFNGVGGVYEGKIAHSNGDGIVIPVEIHRQQPRGKEVHLAIGILKNDRMRWVLEKATELGVTSIIPMITERVVKRPSKLPSRWEHILREAAEQSGRAWLPELREIQSFDQILSAAQFPVLYSTTDAPAPDQLPTPPTLLIGPEGGFTTDEVERAQRQGAAIVSLGVHQLRADTAALVALARI